MCGWFSLPASEASARKALCVMRSVCGSTCAVEMEHLDRDVAVAEGIAREEHAAGRAAADFADDRVLADARLRLEAGVGDAARARGGAAHRTPPLT